MSEEKIEHAYCVYYEDLMPKRIQTLGEITQAEDGTWMNNGRPMAGVVKVVRLDYGDRYHRKAPSKETREKVYAMFGGRCAYCGKPITPKQMRVDHVIPIYSGGPNDISNYMPSCQDCNHIKGAEDIENLRETVTNFLRTIKKDIRYRMLLAYGLIQETPHEIEFLFEKEESE